jgi:hypothetical protein
MEWLILVLVVPLVLVPLVLLFGFAGCGELLEVSEETTVTPTATGLTAKAVFIGNENAIHLSWIGHQDAAKYQVLRGEEGNALAPIAETTGKFYIDASPAPPPLLSEGTTYAYQVKARTSVGLFGNPSNEAKATTLPSAPKLLEAVPLTQSRIKLKWLRISTKATWFRFERRKLPGGLPYSTDLPYSQINQPPELDDDVDEGGTYEYRVVDIVKDGYDDSIQKDVLSPPSNVVLGKPLAFAAAFVVAQPQFPTLENYCLIQRIRVTGTGSKIRLTIAGSNGALKLDGIYISHVAVAGNPWDAAAIPTPIAPPPVDLAAGELTRTFGWVDFDIPVAPVDLLVAFDINIGAGQGNVRYVDIPGVQHYYLSYAQNPGVPPQAGIPDRVPAFVTGAGRHYLVEKLEVL